jgi:hypothetical protein
MTRAVITSLALAACFVASWAAPPASAQDDEEGAFARTPQDCVVVSNIDQTDAIDDQNLIFRMRGKRVYRNHLPRKCPGLARENRIAFETRVGRLCSIDTITVLERLGVGFTPGFTCRLGEFIPLSPEEIEDLETIAEGKQRSQSAIETRSVELESVDEAAEAGAADATAVAPAADAPPSAEPPDETED